ncbi:MAG: PqqD family protein [Chloroflexi bacterium]|nr:PqqD family protein [Chloroflexota bacterium]
MLNLDDFLVLQPDVIFQEMGGEAVVVMPTQASFIVLNASGAYLLPRLRHPTSLRQLADDLCTYYDIPTPQAQSDVLVWAEQMVDVGVCSKE